MTADPRFARRVRRLVVISLVALGVIWGLSVRVLPGHVVIAAMLAVGWLLMPTLLYLSLRRPTWRYGLLLPGTLVGLALIADCVTAISTNEPSRLGWALITAGVLLGGALGAWFWFRWFPVPSAINDPFATGRRAAIGLHAALVIVGTLLVMLSPTAH